MGGGPGGTWRAAALAVAVAPPPLGAAALSGGAQGRRLPGRPPAVRGPGGGKGGGRGGGRGGSRQSAPGFLSLPLGGRGGAAWSFRSRGSAADGGGALFSRPPPPSGCQTLLQALARAPCSPCCRRAVPAGREGAEDQQLLGAAVQVSF